MSQSVWAALGLIAGLSVSQAACAQPAPAGPATPNDYKQDASWLCRPGRADACSSDQSATVIQANGATSLEAFTPDAKAPIDCFYVYPTVSTDPGGNSDMVIDPAERIVAEQQAARFGGVCRVFAPMYRQVTLAALRRVMMGQASSGDAALAYADVKDAWNDYLARDNGGRGVVLVGHSQGSRVLLDLIAKEIDGKPVQKQIVSALVLGMNTPIDPATNRYGSMPLCQTAGQIGCVISYVSFRAASPPPAASRFGKVEPSGQVAACVNPAALRAGKGATESATVQSYFNGKGIVGSVLAAPKPWTKGLDLTTPFASTPGLVSAQCVNNGTHSYLAISIHGDPADPRVDDIPGDILVLGQPLKDWGLHMIDVNLTMGDLVAVVGEQAKTYAKQ